MVNGLAKTFLVLLVETWLPTNVAYSSRH